MEAEDKALAPPPTWLRDSASLFFIRLQESLLLLMVACRLPFLQPSPIPGSPEVDPEEDQNFFLPFLGAFLLLICDVSIPCQFFLKSHSTDLLKQWQQNPEYIHTTLKCTAYPLDPKKAWTSWGKLPVLSVTCTLSKLPQVHFRVHFCYLSWSGACFGPTAWRFYRGSCGPETTRTHYAENFGGLRHPVDPQRAH